MNERTDDKPMQQHPLARLDGDNADGNPAPLGLLDKLGTIEVITASLIDRGYAVHGTGNHALGRLIRDEANSIRALVEQLRTECSAIELQENLGASQDG